MKGRSPTMRHVSRTHRLALDWLFDRINLDPTIQMRYIDTNHQLTDMLTKKEFHTWWVEQSFFFCLTSTKSALSAVQRISACSAAPKRRRRRLKNRKKITGLWQTQCQRQWTWPSLFRKVLHLWTVRLRRKARGYSKPQVKIKAKFQSRRSVEFSRMRKGCSSGCLCRESCSTRIRRILRNSRTFRRLGNRKENLATSFSCSPDRVPHMEKVFSIVRQTLWSKSDGWSGWPRCEHSFLVYIHVCHTSSCISSWARLYGKSAIYQESTLEVCETNYFKRLRGCSKIKQKLPDCPRLTGHILCGKGQLCYVIELFSLRLPKPTSFPTRCYVWEASVVNQSNPGKTGSNVFFFLEHDILKIWIESTGNQWNSSGKFPQNSLHWELSLRFKIWWRNQSVNLSNSKEGSSSCRCTMTLRGENEETTRIVLRILSKWENMLKNSRKDVGHFWGLDATRNGMGPILTNQTEYGTGLLKAWCSTLLRADILYFAPPVLWKEIYSLQRKWRNRWIDSPHCYFCQSAQYLRSKELAKDSPSARKHSRNENGDSMVVPTEFPNTNTISQTDVSVRGKPVARIRAEIRRTSWRSEINRTMLSRWFLEGNWNEDNSSLHLKKEMMTYRHYVESTHYLEIRKHPERDGGFVETRKSAQSWMRRSTFIKDVTVLISWLNPYFETKQFHGFASWVELANTSQKRQKKFLLKTLNLSVQGNM